MKFLVIGTPNGRDHGVTTSQAHDYFAANAGVLSAKTAAVSAKAKKFLETHPIEKAYAIIAGGFAVVVHANDTYELAKLVRGNKLFHYHTMQIIPIADAHDFLVHSAKLIAGKKTAKKK